VAGFIRQAPVSVVASSGGYIVKRCIIEVSTFALFLVLVGEAVVGAAWALPSLAGSSKTLNDSYNARH